MSEPTKNDVFNRGDSRSVKGINKKNKGKDLARQINPKGYNPPIKKVVVKQSKKAKKSTADDKEEELKPEPLSVLEDYGELEAERRKERYVHKMEEIDKMIQENPIGPMKHGFTLFDDVILYHHEGMSGGVTVAQVIGFSKAYKEKFADLKTKIGRVRENDVSFGEPMSRTNYGNTHSTIKALNIALEGLKTVKFGLKRGDNRVRAVDTEPTLYEGEHQAVVPRELAGLVDVTAEVGYVNEDQLTAMFETNRRVLTVTVRGTLWRPIKTTDVRYPRFNTTYRSVTPDFYMFRSLELLIKRAKTTTPLYKAMRLLHYDMLRTSREYILSNGSLEGQIARLAVGQKTYNEMMEKKVNISLPKYFPAEMHRPGSTGEPAVTYEAYKTILNKNFPFAPKPPNAKLFSTDLAVVEAFYAFYSVTPEWWKISTLNKDSSSGLYYDNAPKEGTVVSDLVLASKLLRDIREAASKDAASGNNEAMKAVYNKYAYEMLAEIKNKMEIGPRIRLEQGEKWRNYFPFTSFVQLPAVYLMHSSKKIDPEHGLPLHKCTKFPDRTSIMGWSPYHGGGNDLLTAMYVQATEEGFSIAVYADNLWILTNFDNQYVWYSMDGSSMEVSIKRRTMEYEMKRLVEEYWGGSDSVVLGFRAYAEQFFPHLSIDFWAVLQDVQIKIVGQGSGTNATFTNNHVTMILAAFLLEKEIRNGLKVSGKKFQCWDIVEGLEQYLQPGGQFGYSEACQVAYLPPTSQVYAKCFEEFTVKVKVEMVMVSKKFWLGIDPSASKPVTAGLFPLDLLGQDCYIVPELGIPMGMAPYFMVLDKQRLLNSLTYNKIDAKYQRRSAYVDLLKAMRLKALYMVGGWADPAIAQLIRYRLGSDSTLASADPAALEGYGEAIEALARNIADDMPDIGAEDVMKHVLAAEGVPSLFSMLVLHRDRQYATEFIKELIRKGEARQAYLAGGILELNKAVEKLNLDTLSSGARKELLEVYNAAYGGIELTSLSDEDSYDKIVKTALRLLEDEELSDVLVAPALAELQEGAKIPLKLITKAQVKPQGTVTQLGVKKVEDLSWADVSDAMADEESMDVELVEAGEDDDFDDVDWEPRPQTPFFKKMDALNVLSFIKAMSRKAALSSKRKELRAVAKDPTQNLTERVNTVLTLLKTPKSMINNFDTLREKTRRGDQLLIEGVIGVLETREGDIVYVPLSGWRRPPATQ